MKCFIRTLLASRLFRYVVAGGAIFLVNIASVWFFIDPIGLNETALQRNLSHFLGAEIGLIFGFHFHNFWTWRSKSGNYFRKFFEFHLVTISTILLRQVFFYILDYMQVHWFISTVLPISLIVVINFLGYNRIFFNKAVNRSISSRDSLR